MPKLQTRLVDRVSRKSGTSDHIYKEFTATSGTPGTTTGEQCKRTAWKKSKLQTILFLHRDKLYYFFPHTSGQFNSSLYILGTFARPLFACTAAQCSAEWLWRLQPRLTQSEAVKAPPRPQVYFAHPQWAPYSGSHLWSEGSLRANVQHISFCQWTRFFPSAISW